MWCRRRGTLGKSQSLSLLSRQVCSPGKIWLQRTVNVERDLGEISHCIRNMRPSQLTSTVWGGGGGGGGGGEKGRLPFSNVACVLLFYLSSFLFFPTPFLHPPPPHPPPHPSLPHFLYRLPKPSKGDVCCARVPKTSDFRRVRITDLKLHTAPQKQVLRLILGEEREVPYREVVGSTHCLHEAWF